ncbi:hypothetical protein SAMN05421833_12988 [Microbispora rosea]|uniref:Uncharacterized protein n=1 Tax=Microbispora rosea TaxID=58117 RepID=A0A1N7GJ15_9ACTN|nr:hypothetical protein Mro03_68600 [Microbispora rosea subsp. rosea]SIS12577.1 hypothetical protein SAMN05421833_12988 [Microbispora rosea]
MPPKPLAIDVDDLRKRYESGKSLAKVASEVGYSVSTVYLRLRDAGVPIRTRAVGNKIGGTLRRSALHADVARLYGQGVRVLAMAQQLGTTRPKIVRCLGDVGLPVRSGSEANTIRLRSAGVRADVTRAAHLKFGDGNRELAEELERRGIAAEREHIVDHMNVDVLAGGTLAVEVHRPGASPLSVESRERQRIVDLLHRGFPVLYVWAYRNSRCRYDVSACADQIVATLDLIHKDPSAGRQYRVIRGCGQVVAIGGTELEHRPVVLPPHGRRYGTCHQR